MKKIIQIFTGGWNNQIYCADDICHRIETISQKIPIDAVIIGWNLNTSLYEQVGKFLQEKNIDMYLWLPTFSEIGEIGNVDPVIDIWGNKTQKYILQEGETFEFYCPSSIKNHHLLFHIYDHYFSKCCFTGIFLDKIRTQSYIPGAQDVLGCCCEKCKKEFDNQGYDINQFKNFIEKKGMDEAFKPNYFDIMDGFHFYHPITDLFFDIKCNIYTKEIKKITTEFHKRGLKVGMDVYSPIMARLVGQDISSLIQIADFIKPMMYRRTIAPAGIGFEYQAMKKALNGHYFDEILGTETNLEPMSEKLMEKILDRNGKEKIYPGIEVNYRKDIAKTDKEYVQNSIQSVINADCGGIVFSWDVMLAPDEHIISFKK